MTKLVELHPYEYLYYNQFVGGLEGASRRFVTDYWVNIMPEAVEELHDFLDRTEPVIAKTHNYRVAVCGERVSYEEDARSNLHWIKMPDWRYADFYIAPTHMNCDRNLDGKTIATIERGGGDYRRCEGPSRNPRARLQANGVDAVNKPRSETRQLTRIFNPLFIKPVA